MLFPTICNIRDGGITLSYEHILEGLNPVQKEIVQDTEGNKLVLAAAGSGKTATLTRRISYILEQGVPGWQVLAVTFTNKAAREMKERLISMAGERAESVWIGTFHGICYRILARYSSEIGYDKITIIDDKEQKKLLKEAMELTDLDYDIDVVKSIISSAKNDMILPEDLLQNAQYQHEKDVAHIFIAYEEKKKEMNYFDFDDLIMKTVYLFEVSEKVREHYQRQFRYVSVDEVQDTNIAQFKLMQYFSAHHQNLYAVGDDSQSIYKWRGAQISNIINFDKYFDNLKTYRLEQNYRSTQNIVNAANSVIEHNEERLDKTAFTENDPGEPIYLVNLDDDGREADFVSDVINRMVKLQGHSYKDFAVLYRTNKQSRIIETVFNQLKIPYQLVNGHAFYDRKEIKDITAYLRAIHNEMDMLAFERIINTPKRGIGTATITKIQKYADDYMIPFSKALNNIDDIPKVSAKAKGSIKQFVSLMETYQQLSNSKDHTVADLISSIIITSGYAESLQTGKEEDQTRMENLDELVNMAAKWEEDAEEEKSLEDFLAETSLVNDADSIDDENLVTLMTVHSSKGLEYPVVFIIGMEESVFPHGRSLSNKKDMEEERRLAYVAMTRAEKKLIISHCSRRYEYGQSSPIFCKPSRFIKEIPKSLIKRL
ncbi:DNA helicase [Bacillus phage vB_BauM_KLEB27-3]|nr:DNA helicase [Bacillus phage vB_BauM_KLEB27-3]